METFGDVVRRLRGSTSLRAVAQRAHVDPGHLSKIENGRRRPTLLFARALDAALASGGELTAMVQAERTRSSRLPVPQGSAAGDVAVSEAVAWQGVSGAGHREVLVAVAGFLAGADGGSEAREPEYGQLVEGLAVWLRRTGRRDLLQWLGRAASAAAAAPLLESAEYLARTSRVLAGSHRVDEAVVDSLEALLDIYIRQDDALGPDAAFEAALAHRRLVVELVGQASGVLRDRLLAVQAGLSRLAGWLAFDLGNYEAAFAYYESARRVAHEAHDARLAAFVLCNMSHLATWRGQPRLGIDHAAAARMWADQTDDLALRAYAADVAARAFAADGQELACRRQLDLARASLESADAATSVAHFYNLDLLKSVEGLCLLDLGWPSQAVQRFAEASSLDRRYARNVAFNLTYLGRAQAGVGELDEAARSLGDAVVLAGGNRSARLIQHIRAGRAMLGPGQSTRMVAELDEVLESYGLA